MDGTILLKIIMTNIKFFNFFLQNVDVTTYGFEKFNSNSVVFNIKKSVETPGKSNQFLKEHLIYFFCLYPKTWIQSYNGVGRKTETNERERAADIGAVLPLTPAVIVARSITVHIRVGSRE